MSSDFYHLWCTFSCFCFSSLQCPLHLTLQLTYFLFFVTTIIVLVFFVPQMKLVYLAFFFLLNLNIVRNFASKRCKAISIELSSMPILIFLLIQQQHCFVWGWVCVGCVGCVGVCVGCVCVGGVGGCVCVCGGAFVKGVNRGHTSDSAKGNVDTLPTGDVPICALPAWDRKCHINAFKSISPIEGVLGYPQVIGV